MTYSKHDWKNRGVIGAIPINADNLNEMETGIDEAHAAIENVTSGHSHDGADSRKVSHIDLLDKGSNTHPQIDTQITKLDGIEDGATTDQTDAEIRAAVEAATDSNVFTDGDHTKLNGIEAAATIDQTGAEIKTLYEAEANAYTDTKNTKLTGIEDGATKYPDTGEQAFLDADHNKLDGIDDVAIDTHIAASNPHSESAKSGANSDILSLLGLTTALSIAQGGTGQSAALAAFNALKQVASDTYTGVTERATAAEDVTGTATDKATTPAGLTARMEAPGEIGGTTPAAATFMALQARLQSITTKTDNYSVQITDFGKTIRVNSASDITQSLPSVAASEDGGRITFIRLGAGRVTMAAADSDKFYEGAEGGTIYNESEIGASITFEYVDAIAMWTIVAASGTWIIT